MTQSEAFTHIVAALQDEADPDAVAAMREQYGIEADASYGVPMRRLLQLAKSAGADHDLAIDLWAQGSYEARTIAAMVDQPEFVSAQQMHQWCEDFDNWAIVDTVCFRLFDRCEHAWSMVDSWVADERLFVRRAGFALLWALALHDREAPDERYRRALPLARAHAHDPRPLVGKSITMAMRAIATKRPALRDEVVDLARQLCDDDDAAVRRVGRPIVRSFR
ncbi:MAG: DNA alkylation repair protein [Ornithinimicrobium sp.]